MSDSMSELTQAHTSLAIVFSNLDRATFSVIPNIVATLAGESLTLVSLSAAFASRFPYQPPDKSANISLPFGNRHQLFESIHMLIIIRGRITRLDQP
jgi:hypothetical protein